MAKKKRTRDELAADRELERQQRDEYELEHPVELYIRTRLHEGETFSQISGHLNRIYNPPAGQTSWDLVATIQAAPRPSWALTPEEAA